MLCIGFLMILYEKNTTTARIVTARILLKSIFSKLKTIPVMKILIVSATKSKNYTLGEKISGLLNEDHEMISLEDYPLPLFVPGGEKADEAVISELVSKFENVDGFIFCAPEYNGSIPPILSNLISWISVSTDQWREVFNGKKALKYDLYQRRIGMVFAAENAQKAMKHTQEILKKC